MYTLNSFLPYIPHNHPIILKKNKHTRTHTFIFVYFWFVCTCVNIKHSFLFVTIKQLSLKKNVYEIQDKGENKNKEKTNLKFSSLKPYPQPPNNITHIPHCSKREMDKSFSTKIENKQQTNKPLKPTQNVQPGSNTCSGHALFVIHESGHRPYQEDR